LVPALGMGVIFPVRKLRSETGSSRSESPKAFRFAKFWGVALSSSARVPDKASVCRAQEDTSS